MQAKYAVRGPLHPLSEASSIHCLRVPPEAMQGESARHSRRMVFWMLQLEDILVQPWSRVDVDRRKKNARVVNPRGETRPQPGG